jgi:hypothetical protein
LNCRYGRVGQESLLRANGFERGGILLRMRYGQMADNDRKLVNDTVQETKSALTQILGDCNLSMVQGT